MIDKHHLIFTKKEWNVRPEGKSIRAEQSLIVPMNRDDHNELHKVIEPIPALGFYALRRVRANFEPADNPIESMENLMRAIEQTAQAKKCGEIENKLCHLAIEAIERERQFYNEIRGW